MEYNRKLIKIILQDICWDVCSMWYMKSEKS